MLDRKVIELIAGSGGNGVISFLREKYRPNGGPDGGDGGHGGNIKVRANAHLRTLDHLEGVHRVEGVAGSPGRSKDRSGKKGKDRVVEVPVGTVVSAVQGETRTFLTEVLYGSAETIVAYGGSGGIGNPKFAGPSNQEPLIAMGGEPGEIRVVEFEVKLLADVALVGSPNAGKSTLLSVISRAKPKIADYPFTTLSPILGVTSIGERSLVVLDVPGLIPGAHQGRGLGLEFLRHCERAAGVVQLVDGSAEDLVSQYREVEIELASYGAGLDEKPRIVVVTKMDIPEIRSRFAEQGSRLAEACGMSPLGVSSATREGVETLLLKMAEMTPATASEALAPLEVRPLPAPDPRARVKIEGTEFVVACPPAERIMATINTGSWRARLQLHRELGRLGVIEALERAGVAPGDTVRIADLAFEWE